MIYLAKEGQWHQAGERTSINNNIINIYIRVENTFKRTPLILMWKYGGQNNDFSLTEPILLLQFLLSLHIWIQTRSCERKHCCLLVPSEQAAGRAASQYRLLMQVDKANVNPLTLSLNVCPLSPYQYWKTCQNALQGSSGGGTKTVWARGISQNTGEREKVEESCTIRQPMWLAIQLIYFECFQASTSATVAAEAATEGREGIAANKEGRIGDEEEEEEEDCSQHAAVREPARPKWQVRLTVIAQTVYIIYFSQSTFLFDYLQWSTLNMVLFLHTCFFFLGTWSFK